MTIQEQLQYKINNKTKPVGSLGILEALALKAGTIQNSLTPKICMPHIVVFAADHGIAKSGKVNPYPQSVTAQMVLNFVKGGAAINVFTKQHNIDLTVVDAGVNFNFDPSLPIVHAKINYGTANYCQGNAMSIEEVNAAFKKGQDIVKSIFNKGCNTIGLGEMGIGNTSSASLIMHHLLSIPLNECVGRGTGSTDEQLQQKLKTLTQVCALHKLNTSNITAHELLCCIGGFEITMMVGAYLKAAELNMIIIVDGFIATAALLVAQQLQQSITNYCVFAHCSNESGHSKMLHHLQVTPLLHLAMRLGEGTGAALAIPLLQSAVGFLNEMASFEAAGINKIE